MADPRYPVPSDPSAPLPSRRSLRENQVPAADAAVASLLAGEQEAPAASPSRAGSAGTGRRALVIGGAAAAGLAAAGLGGKLLGLVGGSPTQYPRSALAAAPASGSGTAASGAAGTAASPAAPGATPGATPGMPEATATGAPQTPVELATAMDRDESYTMTAENPAPVSSIDPGLPAGRTAGPISVPVADSPEARRHLLQRAGYGVGAAAEAEIEAAGLDAWLAQQLDPAMPDTAEGTILGWYPLSNADIATTRSRIGEYSWDAMYEVSNSQLARQIFSPRQIYEAVVDLMSNLLHVTIPSEYAWDSAGDYNARVIRAHAYGTFREMLLASGRHPAMLNYLNNNESVDGKINENYGRELLELHTIGVGGGYTEDDVKAAAMILSGRRVGENGEFVYEPQHHVTGAVKVLDFTDPNADPAQGLDVGDRFLAYLASHPQTARTIARKLAIRFISDTPSEQSVEHLAQAYLANDTAIVPVLTELFRLDEFWHTAQSKIRRPLEDVVGTVRAMGLRPEATSAKAVRDLCYEIGRIGQAPLSWVPPNGYPDVASAWMSASQLIRRWNLHRVLMNGWRPEMAPSEEFKRGIEPAAGMTVDQWIDAVASITIGHAPTPQIRQASYTLLNASGTQPADTEEMRNIAPHFAAIMFNSMSFAVR